MSEFQLHLVPYDWTSTSLDKGRFIGLFPDSTIAHALSDPLVSTINIELPVVTPSVAQHLVDVVNGVPSLVPPEDFSAAGQYLNIPLLEVVSDPEYPTFVATYSGVNLANDQDLRDNYGKYLSYSLLNDYRRLREYLWSRLDITEFPRDNATGVFISSFLSLVPEYQQLIEHTSNEELFRSREELKALLQWPELKLAPFASVLPRITPIEIATVGNANDILRLLGADPYFRNLADHWHTALHIAEARGNGDAVPIILPHMTREALESAYMYIDNPLIKTQIRQEIEK